MGDGSRNEDGSFVLVERMPGPVWGHSVILALS